MHSGYNKNENESLKDTHGDRVQHLVGNWQEERALLEVMKAEDTRATARKNAVGGDVGFKKP